MRQWRPWEQRIIDRARSEMRLREEHGADKQVAARTFDTLIKEIRTKRITHGYRESG